MPDPLQATAITSEDISSRLLVATYTALTDGVISIKTILDDLNAAAATITVDLVVNPGGNAARDIYGDRYSRSKFVPTSTEERMPPLIEEVSAGDVIKVYLESTNASDTGVSGSVVFRDARATNVIQVNSSETAAAQLASLTIASGRVSADVTAIGGNTALDGIALDDLLLLMGCVLLGKSTNGGNTFRALDDSKDRITATVDANYNRTAVTLDGA